MSGKNQWVSPRPNGKWAVHGEGNDRDTRICDTQAEAAAIARDIAKNQHSEVIIQRPDGRIRSKDSYGNDPCPPNDTEH
ncbi:MAG: DUF2188 domain-containing protein [Clostridia bacterium]|nr:DUF2188 domain-containing protein [Clostridia bacterium]